VADAKARHRRLLLDPLEYAVLWSDRMVEQSVGIFAYKSYYPPRYLTSLLEAVLLLGVGLFVYRFGAQPRVVRYAVFLALGFLAITCYAHNYPRYLSLGVFPRYTFMTMQGRYAFPVVALLVLVFCRTLLSSRRVGLRWGTAVASAALVLALGFPGFLSRGAKVIQNGTLQAEYRERLYHLHDFVDP
jgi:hypothetical protein